MISQNTDRRFFTSKAYSSFVRIIMNDFYSRLKSSLSIGLIFILVFSLPAFAGKKLEIDDNHWISIGAGMRTSFTSVEDGAPAGDARSQDFDVESIRLYINGQVHQDIKFTLNTEEIDGAIDVLDAFVRFEFDAMFNLWMGRLLTPADRIEMNGPYYALTWNQYTQPLYPSDQGGAAGRLGRDDGIVIWGGLNKFQYAVGFFDGLEGGANVDDEMLFATRIAYNFLNKEDNPGYYTSSTYHGGLGNILTLGFSYQRQGDGTGTATTSGDFSGYAVDLLSESVLGKSGVLTVEAEYKAFDADYSGATIPADVSATNTCFCLFEGKSYFLSGAYLIPKNVGPGKFQPYVRLVDNNPDDADDSDLREVGVNYVMSGHNVRLNFNYGSGDANISGYKGADVKRFSFGLQIQL